MAMENPPWMKMYFLLNMGIFQLVMLVFGGVGKEFSPRFLTASQWRMDMPVRVLLEVEMFGNRSISISLIKTRVVTPIEVFTQPGGTINLQLRLLLRGKHPNVQIWIISQILVSTHLKNISQIWIIYIISPRIGVKISLPRFFSGL